MLEVQIENIIPVTEARDKFNQIVDAVDGTEELYVLTKNGKPAAIVVGVHHLEKLTGESHEAVFGTVAPDASAAPAPTQDQVNLPPTNSEPAFVAPAAPEPVAPETPAATAPIVAETPAAPANAISYENTAAPIAPAGAPAVAETITPIDPLTDPSAPAAIGEAIAPDAVTPTQAGPSADPFALPSEPLDLPTDTQTQGAAAQPATAVDDSQPAPTPPVAPQV